MKKVEFPRSKNKIYANQCFSFDKAIFTAFAEKTGYGSRTKTLEVLMELYTNGALDKLVDSMISLKESEVKAQKVSK